MDKHKKFPRSERELFNPPNTYESGSDSAVPDIVTKKKKQNSLNF